MLFKCFRLLSAAVVLFSAISAHAIPFTPVFSDYPGDLSGTQTNVEGAVDDWFNANYGIHSEHLYLYLDERDTWDGYGVANGWVEENYADNVTGVIHFTDTTDFVTVQWLDLLDTMTLSVFSNDQLLEQFIWQGMDAGTYTFNASGITRLEILGQGGYAGISGLTYDYDGLTDGINEDTNPVAVPEPASAGLLAIGLLGLALISRQKRSFGVGKDI